MPDVIPPLREGFVTARTARGEIRTEVTAGGHPLVLDEPVTAGGTDLGPTPYDLVAAALAACTTITLQMYAARKGWPLHTVVVRVTHDRVHADDDRHCEDAPARLDRMRREVTLEGPLEPAQRARLLEVAERCPVHRTLAAGVQIETSAAE